MGPPRRAVTHPGTDIDTSDGEGGISVYPPDRPRIKMLGPERWKPISGQYIQGGVEPSSSSGGRQLPIGQAPQPSSDTHEHVSGATAKRKATQKNQEPETKKPAHR